MKEDGKKPMDKILILGSQGFIGSAISNEMLSHDYEVWGIDNYSKYGYIERDHDHHPNFNLVGGDVECIYDYVSPSVGVGFKYIIHAAAKIGGIQYFHDNAYTLLRDNERINASAFDFAIDALSHGLNRMIVLSSSMVFESATVFPTPESHITECPPPLSSYGLSKLATEYFAKAAWEQCKLPYTIIAPYNATSVGEEDFIYGKQSHVVPDLIVKCLRGKGLEPLKILGDGNQIRCFTNVRDIARGIRMAAESEAAVNESFNISIPTATPIIDLARLIWSRINPDKEFKYVCEKPFKYDVQKRIPDVSKAKRLLGFEATIPIEQSVDEVVKYIKAKIV
jgi:nucleoside-diphosphate-sugar epimerase